MIHTEQKLDLAKKLYDVGVIQFGSFTLKSGIISPIYVDMRRIISYPELLKQVVQQLTVRSQELKFDLLCGVPLAALPLAAGIALNAELPMIMARKHAKAYGTKKVIEGVFAKGQMVLLIEDVATSGGSIIEAVEKIRDENLIISDALVVIDREQGSANKLKEYGMNLHALYTLSDITDALFAQGIIDATTSTQVGSFIKHYQ